MVFYNMIFGILTKKLNLKMLFNYSGEIYQASAVTFLSTVAAIFLVFLYYYYKNKNLPPGPWGLPYLGYWPFLQMETIHLQLEEMKEKYGDVYSLTVTGRLYIHLGTTKAIKEAHITKADCFRQRHLEFNMLKRVFGDGIVCQKDESWKVLRKFFTQMFKECGMTAIKDPASDPIYEAVKFTVEYLRAFRGDSMNIVPLLTANCSEMVRRLLFRDGGMTPEEMLAINSAYERVQSCFAGSRPLLTGSFAKYVVFPLTPGYRSAMESHDLILDILRNVIRRQEETFDERNVLNSVDYYLKERNDRRKREDPTAEYFSENALLYSMVQFTGDGVLDLALFVAYFIKALLDYPQEQEKIYEELTQVVGFERHPVYEDKTRLPYTNAFLLEVIRTSDFFTIFPSLECTKETTLHSYKIPKGSVTLMNIWAAHHDKNSYEEPLKFDPARYLEESGKQRVDMPIIFGVGKRSCNGEAFAMILAFLFVTTIVQNFVLQPSEESPNTSLQDRNLTIHAHERHTEE